MSANLHRLYPNAPIYAGRGGLFARPKPTEADAGTQTLLLPDGSILIYSGGTLLLPSGSVLSEA